MIPFAFFPVKYKQTQSNKDDLTLIKYIDDLVLISCQTAINCSTYFEYIKSLLNSTLRLR